METFLEIGLPYGLSNNAIVPHAFALGAVFSTLTFRGALTRPVITEKTELGGYGDLHVYQLAGPRLDQGSGDVYRELVRLGIERNLKPNERLELAINVDEFLARLKRPRGGASRRWLEEQLMHLKAAALLFSVPGLVTVATSLLFRVARKDHDQLNKTASEFLVELDPDICRLYAHKNSWSLLSGTILQRLQNSPLSKAIYAFYAVHGSRPFRLREETICKLMDRESTRRRSLKGWLAMLKQSLQEVQEATGWKMNLTSSGLVEVEKKKDGTKSTPEKKQGSNETEGAPSLSQQKTAALDKVREKYRYDRHTPSAKLVLLMNEHTLGRWKMYLAEEARPGKHTGEQMRITALGFVYQQSSEEQNQVEGFFDTKIAASRIDDDI